MLTRRTPSEVTGLPSAAWTFFLLSGADPGCRIHGWVAQLQAGMWGTPSADEVWALHRDALIAEASAHDFHPFWLSQRRPRGDGFDRWREAFLHRHTY